MLAADHSKPFLGVKKRCSRTQMQKHPKSVNGVLYAEELLSFSDLERAQIQGYLELGSKVWAIARILLRSPSTISRKLARCGWHGARPRLHRYAVGAAPSCLNAALPRMMDYESQNTMYLHRIRACHPQKPKVHNLCRPARTLLIRNHFRTF